MISKMEREQRISIWTLMGSGLQQQTVAMVLDAKLTEEQQATLLSRIEGHKARSLGGVSLATLGLEIELLQERRVRRPMVRHRFNRTHTQVHVQM